MLHAIFADLSSFNTAIDSGHLNVSMNRSWNNLHSLEIVRKDYDIAANGTSLHINNSNMYG